MNKYGLIGFPLAHSFSHRFFTEKFRNEQIDAEYLNFEIEDVSHICEIVRNNPQLKGLNVTIPHKESVIPFLDEISDEAKKIGAVNTIKIDNGKLIGFNTDYIGFKNSISPLLHPDTHQCALILGTGGASKAVAHALSDLGLEWKYVSRTKNGNRLTYSELNSEILSHYTVIINTSPVGTFPKIDECPPIPYEYLTPSHLLYDLVYNPAETLFLKKGKERGAVFKNGLEMLELQALEAWKIWNSEI